MEKVRGFEVLPEFKDQVKEIPRRGTRRSSGYDIHAVGRHEVAPKTMEKIPTGLTAYMLEDEELVLRARSGLAFKKQITLQNGVGTIDADYYGQHIQVLIRNEGTETFVINDGDRIAQGIFSKYLITDDDCPVKDDREGGFGHTGV